MNTDLIKQRLTCVEYAQRYGLSIHSSGSRCQSPLRPEASNPSSFVVYDDYFYDFGSNSGGDVIDLCALLECTGDRGMAIRKLAALTGVDDDHTYDAWLSRAKANNFIVTQWHEALTPLDIDYLHSRGINNDTIAALQLGHTEEGRLSIPFFKNGTVTGWTSRAMSEGQEPKYLKPRNHSMTDHSAIWGLNSLGYKSDHLTVAEGAFDAISFYQERVPVLATMGGDFSAEQRKVLYSLARNYDYVLLAFDSDSAGQTFTARLGKRLFKHRIRFRTVRIPPPHKDISDCYAAGIDILSLPTEDGLLTVCQQYASVSAFAAFAKDACRFLTAPEVTSLFKAYRSVHPESDPDYLKELEKACKKAPSEDYVADLVTTHHMLKYQCGVGFYEYIGTHWQLISDEQVAGYVADELGRYRKGTLSRSVLSLLKSDCLFSGEFNQASIFNFRNGTLHLNGPDVSFMPHSPADLCTFCVDYDYDSNARSDAWDGFVMDIMAQDPERVELLQQVAGYTLFPTNVYQVCSFLIGEGSNGKSVFLKLLTQVFGQSNISTVELSALASDFQKIQLRHSLLNIGSETQSDVKGTESVFKSITAGDMISGCYKGKDFINFVPRCKLIFACNSMPKVTDASYGFYRRMNFVSFLNRFVKFPDPSNDHELKADPELVSKLSTQLPAIFNWCLEGYRSLLEAGEFTRTADTTLMMTDFQEMTDPVATFFKETEISFPVERKKLYAAYRDWCMDNGLMHIKSQASFIRSVRRFLPANAVDAKWRKDGEIVRGFKLEDIPDFVNKK